MSVPFIVKFLQRCIDANISHLETECNMCRLNFLWLTARCWVSKNPPVVSVGTLLNLKALTVKLTTPSDVFNLDCSETVRIQCKSRSHQPLRERNTTSWRKLKRWNEFQIGIIGTLSTIWVCTRTEKIICQTVLNATKNILFITDTKSIISNYLRRNKIH
jgi:hypothetical protein